MTVYLELQKKDNTQTAANCFKRCHVNLPYCCSCWGRPPPPCQRPPVPPGSSLPLTGTHWNNQEGRWSYQGGIRQGKAGPSRGNPLVPQALQMFNSFQGNFFWKTKTNKQTPAGWRETRGLPGNKSELLVRSEESPGHYSFYFDDDDIHYHHQSWQWFGWWWFW